MIENFTHKFAAKNSTDIKFGKIVPDQAELTFKLNTGEEVIVFHPTEGNDALTSDSYEITLLDSPLPIETDPEVIAAQSQGAEQGTVKEADTESEPDPAAKTASADETKTDTSESESTAKDESVDDTAESASA